jgi:hypothetical protein
MDPCPFDANVVVIEHQDGTVAIYAHLPQNGARVAEEDYVRRGHPIGLVGNTGFSWGWLVVRTLANSRLLTQSEGIAELDSYACGPLDGTMPLDGRR